jgi:hypothetical protein
MTPNLPGTPGRRKGYAIKQPISLRFNAKTSSIQAAYFLNFRHCGDPVCHHLD